MTASPYAGHPPGGAPSSWGAGRVVALVCGIVLLLPALALLLGGGVLLWADQAERGDDGFLMTSEQEFSSPGYALTTEDIELDAGADWVPLSATLGDVRLEVTATEPSTDRAIMLSVIALPKPFFLGCRTGGPPISRQVNLNSREPFGSVTCQSIWILPKGDDSAPNLRALVASS